MFNASIYLFFWEVINFQNFKSFFLIWVFIFNYLSKYLSTQEKIRKKRLEKKAAMQKVSGSENHGYGNNQVKYSYNTVYPAPGF